MSHGDQVIASLFLTGLVVVLVAYFFFKKPYAATQATAQQPQVGCTVCRIVETFLCYMLPPTVLFVTILVGVSVGWLESGLYCIPVLLLVTVYWFSSFRTVATTDRAVKTMFGRPYATVESGLRWVPYLIGDLDPRPTIIQTLDFPHRAGIVTRAGEAVDEKGVPIEGRVHGPVNLEAEVTLIFQYPRGDALMRAVVLLPRDKDQLTDLFEEPVLDAVRTTGGNVVWINLVQRRAHFAELVLKQIKESAGPITNILRDSGIKETVQIAIKHLTIPPEILESINAKEKAELQREGTVIAADAERQKRKIEGAGTAAAKKQLLDVIREHPENLQAQALFTLIEMAQGQATTVFPLSTDLTNVLSKTLRGGDIPDIDTIMRLLTPEQKEALLQKLQSFLKPSN